MASTANFDRRYEDLCQAMKKLASDPDAADECYQLIDLLRTEVRCSLYDDEDLKQELKQAVNQALMQVTILEEIHLSQAKEQRLDERKKPLHEEAKAVVKSVKDPKVEVSETNQNESTRSTSPSDDHVSKVDEKIARQNIQLERACQVMAETEEIATDVSMNLGRNREYIEASKKRTTELREMTKQASGLIKNMSTWWKKI